MTQEGAIRLMAIERGTSVNVPEVLPLSSFSVNTAAPETFGNAAENSIMNAINEHQASRISVQDPESNINDGREPEYKLRKIMALFMATVVESLIWGKSSCIHFAHCPLSILATCISHY